MKELPQLQGLGDPGAHAMRDDGSVQLPPCVDRRAFLANSGLLAVGALLAAACGDGQIGNTVNGPVASGSVTVTPGQYPALSTVGGIAQVSGTSTPIALVRSSASEYRAFLMTCTHQGTTVAIVNGATSFRCPNHGAMFTSAGRWTGGEPTSNLKELTVVAGAGGSTLVINF